MKNQISLFHRLKVTMTLLHYMMDQMSNQLKLKDSVEIWEVLLYQVLEIHYLSNLNQILLIIMLDFSQQSTMVQDI